MLTQQLSKNQTVTEELKQNDPLQWTKEMNRIYQQAEEIVLKELVLSVAELEQYEPHADSPYRQMDLFSLLCRSRWEILQWHRQKCHRTDSLFGMITAEQVEEFFIAPAEERKTAGNRLSL